MKILTASLWFLLLIGIATAQTSVARDPSAPSVEPAKAILTIPVGTSIPLSLKQAISTKTARDGDPVYAETAFPFVVNERVVIPAGTYIQGKIERVQRGGHVKGRAEVLIHFTSMVNAQAAPVPGPQAAATAGSNVIGSNAIGPRVAKPKASN